VGKKHRHKPGREARRAKPVETDRAKPAEADRAKPAEAAVAPPAGATALEDAAPSSGRVDHLDPLGALAAARAALEDCQRAIERRVGEARAAGLSWKRIGEALAVSPQAAHQRYGRALHAEESEHQPVQTPSSETGPSLSESVHATSVFGSPSPAAPSSEFLETPSE
jgi:hypothetical protein